jgi:hypothetical protein
MNLETYLYDKLHRFVIVLESEGNPRIKITINSEVKFDQPLIEDRLIVNCFKELEKYQPGILQIEMYGKSNRDTVVKDGVIVKDTTVTVDDVIVNGVSLTKVGHIHRGVYRPYYWDNYTGDKPETITGARTMGFNGTWTYTWDDSPIRHIINQFDTVEQNSINTNMQDIFDALDIR